MNVLVPLADGFEEIEAITIIDVLRRAEIPVTTVAITMNTVVTGSHNIPVTTDTVFEAVNLDSFDALVLPGGMPGARNLQESEQVISWVRALNNRDGIIGAICAAPIVLGPGGADILHDKKVTCYPGYEQELGSARPVPDAPVVVDGTIITSRGPGCAIEFALQLVALFTDRSLAKKLGDGMQVHWM